MAPRRGTPLLSEASPRGAAVDDLRSVPRGLCLMSIGLPKRPETDAAQIAGFFSAALNADERLVIASESEEPLIRQLLWTKEGLRQLGKC